MEKNIEAAMRLHGNVLQMWMRYICKKRNIEREKYIAGLKIKEWMSKLQMRFHTNRWNREHVMVKRWMKNYNTMPSLYVIEKPMTYGGTIAEQQRDVVMGRIIKQLPDLETIKKLLPEFGTMDYSGKLVRESNDNNAEVRQLNGGGVDDTPFISSEQLKTKQMKIEYSGKPYNCTKCGKVDNTTNPYEIIKYYSCGMVRGKISTQNGDWINKREGWGGKEDKERNTDGKIMSGEKKLVPLKDLWKCTGSLKVIYWRDRQHTFRQMKQHTCMDEQWSDGKQPDDRLPNTVLGPSLHRNVTKEKLVQMKCALVQQKIGWENLHSCGTDGQHLPGLSSEKKMTGLKKMSEGLIDPF